MKYPGPVVEQLTKAGAGYVGAKGDFAADADAVEDASDVRRVLVSHWSPYDRVRVVNAVS